MLPLTKGHLSNEDRIEKQNVWQNCLAEEVSLLEGTLISCEVFRPILKRHYKFGDDFFFFFHLMCKPWFWCQLLQSTSQQAQVFFLRWITLCLPAPPAAGLPSVLQDYSNFAWYGSPRHLLWSICPSGIAIAYLKCNNNKTSSWNFLYSVDDCIRDHCGAIIMVSDTRATSIMSFMLWLHPSMTLLIY